jgi:single-strand DNA-binding protein
MNYHKVLLAGHLGKDPEIKTTQNGKKMVLCSLAYTEKFKGKDGKYVETVDWFNIVGFEHVANFFEKYLKKGSNVFLEGKHKNNSYTDSAGVKKFSSQFVIESVKPIGAFGNKSEDSEPQGQPEPGVQGKQDDDPELPF